MKEPTDLCIVMEHYFEAPESEFTKACDEFRGDYGSYEWRDRLIEIAERLTAAYDAVNEKFPHLGDDLMKHCGCWDFDVVPYLLDALVINGDLESEDLSVSQDAIEAEIIHLASGKGPFYHVCLEPENKWFGHHCTVDLRDWVNLSPLQRVASLPDKARNNRSVLSRVLKELDAVAAERGIEGGKA